MDDVVSDDVYNHPHSQRQTGKNVQLSKNFFFSFKIFLRDFLFLTLQFSMNDLFMPFVVVQYNEVIKTISSLFIFFDEKISRAQKHVTPRSLCAREKLLPLLFSVSLFLFCQLIFACDVFLCARNIFVKKKKKKKQTGLKLSR